MSETTEAPPADVIDDRLIPDAARRDSYSGSGKGTIYYQSCPCCGHVDWTSSAKDPETHLVAIVREAESNRNCPECRMVFERAPEIFNWVIGVAQTIERRAGIDPGPKP